MAGRGDGGGSHLTSNLTRSYQTIERAQLLTAHNLAVLVDALGLRLDWADLAMRTWEWLLGRGLRRAAQLKGGGRASGAVTNPELWYPLMRSIGHAWRQCLFYLSMLPSRAQQLDAVQRMETALEANQARFPSEPLPGHHARIVERMLLPLREAINLAAPAQEPGSGREHLTAMEPGPKNWTPLLGTGAPHSIDAEAVC